MAIPCAWDEKGYRCVYNYLYIYIYVCIYIYIYAYIEIYRYIYIYNNNKKHRSTIIMALSMGLGMLLFMALSMGRALSMVLGGCTCQCLTYKATLNHKITMPNLPWATGPWPWCCPAWAPVRGLYMGIGFRAA